MNNKTSSMNSSNTLNCSVTINSNLYEMNFWIRTCDWINSEYIVKQKVRREHVLNQHTWISNRTRNWSPSLLSSSMTPFAWKLISLEWKDPKVIGDSLKLFPADQLQLLLGFCGGGTHRHLTEYAPITFHTISNSCKVFSTSIMISLGSAWDCKQSILSHEFIWSHPKYRQYDCLQVLVLIAKRSFKVRYLEANSPIPTRSDPCWGHKRRNFWLLFQACSVNISFIRWL